VTVFLSGFILIVPFVFSQMSSMIDTFIASVRSLQVMLATQGLASVVSDVSWLPAYVKEYLLDLIVDPQFAARIQSDIQANISQIIGL
jgi:hypothetical protein